MTVSIDGSTKAALFDENNNRIGQQHPLTINSNSIYCCDVDFDNSDFTDWSGDPSLLFKSPFSASITNSTSDNPKSITVAFTRTVKALQVGIGEANGGSFSNLKISLLGSGGAVRSIFDQSTLDTKKNSLNCEFSNELFNAIKIEFYTSDPVSLSNLTIQKSTYNTSQIQGRKDDGSFTEFGATNNGNFKVAIQEYGDTPAVDSFARLRVSNPYTLFDSKQLHDKQPLFWDESLGGSATSVHVTADACTRMTVTANAADYAIRQTKQRFNYQPGKSELIFMTYHAPQTSGITKRIGAFDGTGTNNLTPNNGIFFETDGDISWNICKNGTITETAIQENWNVDKLNGAGGAENPSGITLDTDACQILVFDFEWLGVGRVRVGFVIDGLVYYVHYFNHANNSSFSSVYMSTPNLPLRYSIETDGTNGDTLDHICSSVISEGGIEKTGILRAVDTETTHVDANVADTTYAVVGIRLKSTYRDVTVAPEYISMLNETNDDFKWSLCLNPTVAGTFTYTDVANSAVQHARGATANTVSDRGLVIDSGYASGGVSGGADSRKMVTSLRIGTKIDGTADQLVLCATPLTANADIHGALTFRELL